MSKKDLPGDESKKDPQVEIAKQMINGYRNRYKSINPKELFNLSDIKTAVTEDIKTEPLDAVVDTIQDHLGDAESAETLRFERWHGKVTCPYCKSEKVKRLALEEQKNKDIYRYKCLACTEEFNDDSETDIEAGVPSINTWMLCWYLLGVTSSVQYIAAKLGLSIGTVELMIQHMQRIFNANEPMKHFLPFDKWSASHGKGYKVAMQEALAKQMERFRGFSLGQEADTAEVRRNKNKSKPKF